MALSVLPEDTNFYSRPCGRGDGNPRELRQQRNHFYSRPCGRGDEDTPHRRHAPRHFYSRPCGRGDLVRVRYTCAPDIISTHAPAGGATRPASQPLSASPTYFYSRPCGRGDTTTADTASIPFPFLLTPLREGRQSARRPRPSTTTNFYSRPCGRGDREGECQRNAPQQFLLTPLREGRPSLSASPRTRMCISTHAPAGGATAIFHKSVMRFCGKLPKDDTVLCLASFGFPRRDPKAVYLAWISCANLPQKCVRQGLALKDQGTSCFHEGLASHAFDPVLV